MARLGGLGKGLGALIPSEAGSIEGDSPRLVDLPIDSVIPNQHQPRVHFDEESLAELAASIREIGVLQPVLVRPIGDSAYELVAGERRWRAARRAGLAVIPAIVRNTDDLGLVERALVENLHRQDLTPLEEAAAYQQLIEDFGLTHEQVANRVGKSRSAVTNTLRLMSLPAAIQHLLADGRLSAGHGHGVSVVLHNGALICVELAVEVGTRLLGAVGQLVVAHGALLGRSGSVGWFPASPDRAAANAARPRAIRLFTVPAGMSRTAAMSA